jgi:hypothetical protein
MNTKDESHVAQLSEHYETVMIFTTRNNGENGTIHCQLGAGCYFSRYGHIKLWILSEEARHITESKEND